MVPRVKRIYDLRVDNDLTQKDIADILGISRSKYSQIEIGFLDFDLKLLCTYAKYFKVSVDYIYGLSDIKECYSFYDYNNVYKRLKDYRKSLGISQEDLCLKVGICQSSYSRYEQGGSITGYKLYILAKGLGISMDYLLGCE